MNPNWKPLTQAIYALPDGTWKYAVDHQSWQGSNYKVITDGYLCKIHGTWFPNGCSKCLLRNIDFNNILRIGFIPEEGQKMNVPDQLAMIENTTQTVWFIENKQFKFKVGDLRKT